MTELVECGEADLEQALRDFIERGGYAHNARLPTERTLAAEFGVTRAALRKALDALEAAGLIWRHVGRGTFVGARPVPNLGDVSWLVQAVSPPQVMDARIAVEPELARLAARHAAARQIDGLRVAARRCRAAPDWRGYEAMDNQFHLEVARAAQNKLLLHLFETLNVVRRSIVWGQKRTTPRPPETHFSFAQHDRIVEAVATRDEAAAAAEMRAHLQAVRAHVLPGLPAVRPPSR
jgi:DNA-binding FadR family transcriptional regulator